MVKVNTRYECEVCKHEWKFQKLAELCEKYQCLPLNTKIGDEVKLRNRNNGYTVAVVKDICIIPNHFILEPKDEGHLASLLSFFEKKIEFHRRVLRLDREVTLDHKWEDSTSSIDPYSYVLSDDEAKDMERDDNNCW